MVLNYILVGCPCSVITGYQIYVIMNGRCFEVTIQSFDTVETLGRDNYCVTPIIFESQKILILKKEVYHSMRVHVRESNFVNKTDTKNFRTKIITKRSEVKSTTFCTTLICLKWQLWSGEVILAVLEQPGWPLEIEVKTRVYRMSIGSKNGNHCGLCRHTSPILYSLHLLRKRRSSKSSTELAWSPALL